MKKSDKAFLFALFMMLDCRLEAEWAINDGDTFMFGIFALLTLLFFLIAFTYVTKKEES